MSNNYFFKNTVSCAYSIACFPGTKKFSRQHFYVSITNLNFYVFIIAAMSLAGSANA